MEVGDEPVVALFATCRSSTNVFATLCTVKGPKDAHVVSGSFCVVDLGAGPCAADHSE